MTSELQNCSSHPVGGNSRCNRDLLYQVGNPQAPLAPWLGRKFSALEPSTKETADFRVNLATSLEQVDYAPARNQYNRVAGLVRERVF